MKNKTMTLALSLLTMNAIANTSLENSYLELDKIKVESSESVKIIKRAKEGIKKIHQEIISIGFQEKVHNLKRLGVEIKDFQLTLKPLQDIDLKMIAEQEESMIDLENTIDLMKVDVSQSHIIKINRRLLDPYFKLKEEVSKYTMDIGMFRETGFMNYKEMFEFAKHNTNITKEITKNKINYKVDEFNEIFCKEYLTKQVETGFIYENRRSFITEPLLGWDKLKETLNELYKECNEDS